VQRAHGVRPHDTWPRGGYENNVDLCPGTQHGDPFLGMVTTVEARCTIRPYLKIVALIASLGAPIWPAAAHRLSDGRTNPRWTSWQVELLTGIEGASSRPVRKIVLIDG
jgi:hypothetical protein